MSDRHTGLRRRFTTVVTVIALMAAAPLAVIAAHTFDDVPDSNQFHESIAWMRDNGVTFGCNPPDNTLYCPEDNVSRQQMAAFMRRLAQTEGTAGANITDPADTVNVSGQTYVELATIDTTPKAEANVVLNAHVALTNPTDTEGSYSVIVARDSCEGQVVGSGAWEDTPTANGATNTVSIAASDLVTGPTTYVLCAAETDETLADATAGVRGLTANWQPTA